MKCILFCNILFTTASCQPTPPIDKVVTYTDVETALKDKKNIIKLDLSGQNLESVPADVFKIQNICELDLSGNNIKALSPEFAKLKKLQRLDVSDNQIQSFAESLLDLNQLWTIDAKDKHLSEYSALESAIYFRSVGDKKLYESVLNLDATELNRSLSSLAFSPVYAGENTSRGFVTGPNENIVGATTGASEPALNGSMIEVSLLCFYMHDFPEPESEDQEVLLAFEANNRHGNDYETVGVCITKVGKDGQLMSGSPVFRKLHVDGEPISLRVRVISVVDKRDKEFLKLMNNTFSNGFDVDPVRGRLTDFVTDISRRYTDILRHDNNKEIFNQARFELSLDNGIGTVKLREGLFIAAQVKDVDDIDWPQYKLNANNRIMRIVGNTPLATNYFILSIKKMP